MTIQLPIKDSYSLLLGLLVSSIAQVQAAEILLAKKGEPAPDEAAVAYGRINDVLHKLARHGHGLLRLEFKLDAHKTRLPLSAIHLLVRSADADHAVKLDSEGRFTLPMLPEPEARGACLLTNVPQDRLAIHGSLEPAVSHRQLTMAIVRRMVRAISNVRQEMLPRHLRWLLPHAKGIRVCSPEPIWVLKWRESAQVLDVRLQVAAGERDPHARKAEFNWPCTLLAGEAWWGDAARLVAPSGTRLSLMFEGQ
jgi:hypothetical protein